MSQREASVPALSPLSARLRLIGLATALVLAAAVLLALGHEMRHVDVPQLIKAYGVWFYLFTFVWTFVEGETFVLIAGFAAAQGLLSAPLLLVAAWLGSFAGDQCYFWIGRHYGLRLLAARPRWRARVDRAIGWVKRYDTWFILSFRFIYGVRNFSSFAFGISGIGWQRFLALNLSAALLWAGTFVFAGYFCGRAFERMLGQLADRFSLLMLGVFALLLVTGVALHRLRQRRRAVASPAAE